MTMTMGYKVAHLAVIVQWQMFKQGTGDPSGFKHVLYYENTKPGTVIRYVGNRFNVLFYLAGKNFFKIKETEIIVLSAEYVLLQKQFEV